MMFSSIRQLATLCLVFDEPSLAIKKWSKSAKVVANSQNGGSTFIFFQELANQIIGFKTTGIKADGLDVANWN